MNTNDYCHLELNDVSYSINGKKILDKITVSITENCITGVIGPSGSGKSTFLRLLNKLISPSSGSICYNKNILANYSSRNIRKEIGLLQQRSYLFPGTARQNLEYGPKIWGIEYTQKELEELLERVGLSSEFLSRNISELSGGEQQRVSLARTLANKPKILLADEPTSSLDIISEEIIEETISQLSKEGIKVIIVTHSLEQTKRITDQLLFLKEGHFISKTTTKQFFEQYSDEEIRTMFRKRKEA